MSELFNLEMKGIKRENIDLLPKDALMQREEKDKVGFGIGQDWAFYRQHLPDNADAAIFRGFETNTAYFSAKQEVDRFIRKWLQLRYHAYLRERTIADGVSPQFLKAIDINFCRVTEAKLTHSTQDTSDWSVERLCNDAGYAWGNLAIISRNANEARGSMNYEEIVKASESSRKTNGLSQDHWLNYRDLVRGPYFWAGQIQGIEPIRITAARMVFVSPSQLLQDIAYWAVCHKNPEQRLLAKKILNEFSPSGLTKSKLKKLFVRIERHLKKRHSLYQTFSNPSCHQEFLDWYESSNLTVKTYLKYYNASKNRYLNLPITTALEPGLLEEWLLPTKGHLY